MQPQAIFLKEMDGVPFSISNLYVSNSKCDLCHEEETWTHCFQSCPKCAPEKHELYATWDDISLKYNLNKIRFPPDSSPPNCLKIDFDGRCTKVSWSNWANKKRLPKAVALEIYKALAIYVSNCYKNTTWYNRPNPSFIRNKNYPSALQRQQLTQPPNLNHNHSNAEQN